MQEHREERQWSIEILAYRLWLFGYDLSTNKIWRLEQNLVASGNRPLKAIDYNFIVALEGVFEKSILGGRAVRTRSDFLTAVEVAKWEQFERQKREWSFSTLSWQLTAVGFEASQNMIYRLEQNLVPDGKRPLQTIDYELLRSLREVFGKN